MSIYQKCIPDAYYASIFEIRYETLKKQGITSLFFDLDNTIIGYDEDVLSEKHVAFFKNLQKEFNLLVISNTSYKRVSSALMNLDVPFVWHAAKPLKFGFRKGLKILQAKKENVLVIGDQLMTDIYGSKRMGFKAFLVAAVKRKSDRKLTKINRRIEKRILEKIKKKMPDVYEERLRAYVESY
ncbi:MAG: YqeG family HAD IIIA-type phosphatase [Acholeplasmataceae bacterium]|nr:YqeG family HAD IIIA-type phosphatase [Acholeplasmataceae bacterium]